MMEGLCFRCEQRAQFLENGSRPRFECGLVEETKYACYSYRPVTPVVLQRLETELKERPDFGPWMLSARMKFVRVAKGKLGVKVLEDGKVLWVEEVS